MSALKLLCLPLAVPLLLGDLTPPPGPVAPTMKRLDEVEARTAISTPQTQILESGSYYLTQDLVMTGAEAFGVRIDADDVTLDLNGFTIRGTGVETGVRVFNPASNVVVRNGHVVGCTPGVWLSFTAGDPSRNVRVEDVSVADSPTHGIFVVAADDVRIERCTAVGNGNDGVNVNNDSNGVRVTDGLYADNGDYGISVAVPSGSVEFSRNLCVRNGLAGIAVAGNASLSGSVMDNRCFDNVGNGISLNGPPNNVVIARNVAGGSGGAEFVFIGSTGAAPVALVTDANPSPFANIQVP
jgi:nitrous oxidase accessory protein NosD